MESLGLQVENFRIRLNEFEIRAAFEVKPGERLVILGRSGSGKTTLLRAIAGLGLAGGEGRMEGRVSLNGEDLTLLPPEKRGIGLVFQDQALFPALSVLENACFGLRIRGVGRREREGMGLEWLARVGLKDHAGGSVEKLSGGERQRLALVRALIWKPKLLLLDEPFSALDQQTRKILLGDLLGLLRAEPIPVLFVTHELADVESFSTQRISLKEEGSGKTRHFTP